MANIRRQGGATQRNMIVSAQVMKGKNGKDFAMIAAQMDMRDPRTKEAKDTNPHLESHPFTTPDGQQRVAHGRAYTMDQFQKMQAAGSFIQDKDGKFVGTLKADVSVVKGKEGGSSLIIRTDKPMGKSDYKVGPKTLQTQAKSVQAMRETVAAEREAVKATPEAEAQGPAMETEAEVDLA